MRSLLFVPGDSPKKLDKALSSGADVLLIDLEDSVSANNKPQARKTTAEFLKSNIAESRRPRLFVRVNAFDTGLTDHDLEQVMHAAPDGIMLPKSISGADVAHLDGKIGVQEAINGITDGKTEILVVATETAASVFNLGSYGGSSPRLQGMTWGGEDLSADIGALANRDESGAYTDVYRLARALCLLGAAAAGVQPIDSVFTNFRDEEGLKQEASAALRDGFTAKMAIHPAQVPVINEVFTPGDGEIEKAQRIVKTFADAGNAGVIGLDGEMLDMPHLKRAEKLLARARAAGKA
ncbi:CoA ester lyase [Rhizobiales bacterium]|uniref:HpcH/HpaI aldolase/citrate lyase family protein n=1 Tax=Hongsoonwoonella zoysiae TaxID=2821844 RepID=UPI001560CA97|nr:CoA ester lyase [Hongsoonwoonella zoysiae]NRG18156.1 CoA ester lyase [Hongsoonwoonella zoysiae]